MLLLQHENSTFWATLTNDDSLISMGALSETKGVTMRYEALATHLDDDDGRLGRGARALSRAPVLDRVSRPRVRELRGHRARVGVLFAVSRGVVLFSQVSAGVLAVSQVVVSTERFRGCRRADRAEVCALDAGAREAGGVEGWCGRLSFAYARD